MRSPLDGNRARLLVSARHMLQTRGFNAFSFRDLADAVQIKSSSVHYHFPTKEDLGLALVREYREELQAFLDELAQRARSTPISRLKAFMGLFETTAAGGDKLCLAGMLASDFATLGEPLMAEVRGFFLLAENWLAEQILLVNTRRGTAHSRAKAAFVLSSLEGALLLGRAMNDTERVRNASVQLTKLIQDDTAG